MLDWNVPCIFYRQTSWNKLASTKGRNIFYKIKIKKTPKNNKWKMQDRSRKCTLGIFFILGRVTLSSCFRWKFSKLILLFSPRALLTDRFNMQNAFLLDLIKIQLKFRTRGYAKLACILEPTPSKTLGNILYKKRSVPWDYLPLPLTWYFAHPIMRFLRGVKH